MTRTDLDDDLPARPPVSVRRASPEDLPAVLALADELQAPHHAAHPSLFVPAGFPEQHLALWRRALEGPNGVIFLAECEGRVVGYVAADMIDETVTLFHPLRLGRVNSIAVAASMRGRGIGRALMAQAETWARVHGAQDLQLVVWAFNEGARRLYEELGYAPRAIVMGKAASGPSPGDAA
jgi:ribosomal protein S18 acetylase RimI-like enzyme